MEITSEVHLRGTAWNQTIAAFSPIFATRPHYMLYMLAMSIGIMYDQRIAKPEENLRYAIFNATKYVCIHDPTFADKCLLPECKQPKGLVVCVKQAASPLTCAPGERTF